MDTGSKDVEEEAAGWLSAISKVGIHQFIAQRSVLGRLRPDHIRALNGPGLTLTFESWEADGAPAPVSSAVILGDNPETAARRIKTLLSWCDRHPGLTVIVLAEPDLRVGGRRLDQFVSPHAPLSPEVISEISATKETR